MHETFPCILPLADASAELPQVGGKGASLARLASGLRGAGRTLLALPEPSGAAGAGDAGVELVLLSAADLPQHAPGATAVKVTKRSDPDKITPGNA